MEGFDRRLREVLGNMWPMDSSFQYLEVFAYISLFAALAAVGLIVWLWKR